jgi:hypothetical protein
MLRLRRRLSGDEGFGMITVMGFSLVLFGLLSVAFTVGTNALQSSRSHYSFDQALDNAETGIDQMLGRLQKNTSYTLCGCTTPTGGFATEAAERSWARSTVAALAASQPSLLQSTGNGQFLSIHPSNRYTVYSMGWVPSYAKAVKTRLLKAEYLFAPYKPTEAILTNGDLDISGSVLVDATDTTVPAGVHTNANVTTNNASLTVSGPVTSSGTYDVNGNVSVGSGSGGGMPLETVPSISARYVYTSQSAAYSQNWYDLCPDGSVHSPDSAATTPCTGTALSTGGASYRGWDFTPGSGNTAPLWSMTTAASPYQGVYYVYQGDAEIGHGGGNSSTAWNATVIAEAKAGGSTDSATCNKLGGNISWKLYDVSAYISGLVMEAEGDLTDSANNNAGDGLFAAGDQVYLSTSSATLTGSVVAANQCPNTSNPSTVQGVTLHYDQNAEAPIQSVVRTTLWLEYVGS